MIPNQAQGFRLSPLQRLVWRGQCEGQITPANRCTIVLRGGWDLVSLQERVLAAARKNLMFRMAIHETPGFLEPFQFLEAYKEPVIAAFQRSLQLRWPQGIELFLEESQPNEFICRLSSPGIAADVESLLLFAENVFSEQPSSEREGEVLHYGDIAEWLHEFLELEETQPGREEWINVDLPAFGRYLPAHSVSKKSIDYALRHCLTVLSSTESLRSASERNGCTQPIALLGAWALLLAKRSGGATASGVRVQLRQEKELARMTGPLACITPLILSTDNRSPTADAWLSAVADGLAHSEKWAEYFDWPPDTQEALYTFASLPETTGWRNVGEDRTWLIESIVPVVHAGGLALLLRDESVEFLACPSAWNTAQLVQLESELVSILDNLCPGVKVNEIGIGRPRRSTSHSVSRSLPEQFLESASQYPDRLAVISGDQSLTYGELLDRALQLAGTLRTRGITADTIVPIIFPRSVDAVVALLGTWLADGAYSFLDPNVPEVRLRTMIAECGARHVLAAEPWVTLGSESVNVLTPGSWNDESAFTVDHYLPSHLDASAYVTFTSGSTGIPKGVVISHRAAAGYNRSILERLPADEPLHFGIVSSLAADLALTCLFPCLTTGGTLHLFTEEESVSASELKQKCIQNPLDVLKIVPSHLAALLGDDSASAILPRRVLVLGGESFPVQLRDRISSMARGLTMWNHYGPTESTVGVLTLSNAQSYPSALCSTIPIGTPLPHVDLRLMGEYGELIASGLAGEIFLGGDSIARGYLNDPAETASRFVPDPWSSHPGARIYATGDLAKELPDGVIEYLGRRDDQVKIRGYRVEPGDVESALLRHSSIQQAKVIAITHHSSTALVAFVTPAPATAKVVRSILTREAQPSLRGVGGFTLDNGLYFVHRSRSECDYLYREIFAEDQYFQEGIHLSTDTPCVFDVGANAGAFSVRVALLAPDARIFAFEPIPAMSELLSINCRLYCHNATVLNIGLAEKPSTAIFTHYPAASVLSTRFPNAALDEERARAFTLSNHPSATPAEVDAAIDARLTSEQVVCPLSTISEQIRLHRVEHIHLLKIDAQRGELDILRGIENEDWPRIGQIVLEMDNDGESAALIRNLLRTHGFRFVERPNGAQSIVYARQSHLPQSTSPLQAESRRWCSPMTMQQDLLESINKTLPSHMVPGRVHLLLELPVTSNGKVDCRKLEELDESLLAKQPKGEPRNEIEAKLVDLWAQLLGHEVGIWDNFFQAGGDSILAIQMASSAANLGLSIRVETLFRHPVIAELAPHVESAAATDQEEPSDPGRFPLSPIQRWHLEQFHDADGTQQSILLAMKRPCGVGELQDALCRLVRHHESLRLRVNLKDPTPTQVYGPFEDISILVRDYTEVPLEQALALLFHESVSPNLEDGPVFSAALLERPNPVERRLLLRVHRFAADAVSWRVLLHDLDSLLNLTESGSTLVLPSRTTSYRQWVDKLMTWKDSRSIQEQVPFWQTQLPHPEEQHNFQNHSAPNRKDEDHGGSVDTALGEYFSFELITVAAQQARCSLEELLLAAFITAYRKWSGQSGLSIDLESIGRSDSPGSMDLHRTVGWFTALFPVRFEPTSSEPVQILAHVKDCLRRTPNGGTGYGVLRYLAEEPALFGVSPVVNFNYLGGIQTSGSAYQWFDIAEESLPSCNDSPPCYGLRLLCGFMNSTLRMQWRCRPGFADQPMLNHLHDQFTASLDVLLCDIAHMGGTPLQSADFNDSSLSEEDFQTLLLQLQDGAR